MLASNARPSRLSGASPELLLNGLARRDVVLLLKGEQRLQVERLRVLGRDLLHGLELLARVFGLALPDQQ